MSELNLPLRKEGPVGLTWDLTRLYKDEDAVDKELCRLSTIADDIVKEYKGVLKNAEKINACLDEYREFFAISSWLSNYSELVSSVDYTDTKLMVLSSKVGQKVTECTAKLSFIESEIASLDESIISEAVSASKLNACYLKDILRSKPYRLSPDAERVLASLSRTFGAPYEIYNVMKLADIQFEPFKVGDKLYPLGYSLFEDDYEYDDRDDVRRAAFEAFSNKIAQYQNTTAAAYNALVQYEKTMANLRGFDNVIDSLLFPQKVDRALYDRQIDLIMDKLSVHMRKYAKLIKRTHHLDKMTFADLKLSVDSEYEPKVSIEESKEYMKKGLAILGEDYLKMVDDAFEQRWVDFAKNVGKSTGGFCASPYQKDSYILLSWNDRMSDVLTLAHELGHAGHFRLCGKAQGAFDTEVSTYFVEAPSTCNELIMCNYLLKTNDDPRFRRWVLSSIVGDTYYHNCVTHFCEAAYQREVYRLVDAGEAVTAETLNEIMMGVLKKFWGDTVELNEGAMYTWMRQPHYYMGLYSYTYSAGLTIATQMCKRIENEGAAAVEDWKNVLRAGSTLSPVELAKLGGIDITTDAPLLDTIDTIGEMIDEMISLTDIIEKK